MRVTLLAGGETDHLEQWRRQARSAFAQLRGEGLIHQGSFLGGRWHTGGARTVVDDPATETPLWEVSLGGENEAAEALARATAIQSAWGTALPTQRAAVLRRWAELIRARAGSLATLIVLENGKPLAEAAGEVAYAASYLDWYAAEAERLDGQLIAPHLPGSSLTVNYAPVGVVLAITPWNFPAAMITRKAAAALASGCPVIVKPALETPLIALALAGLSEQAGLPPGVFSVLLGLPEAVAKPLIKAADVRALSFTGSTETGRQLAADAGATVKRISLELGGHAPFIVCADADLAAAVGGAVKAKFATSGQDCLAANRIYVHRRLHDDFTARFTEAVDSLRSGHGLDPAAQIGPMTKREIVDKCADHVSDAVQRGAAVTTLRTNAVGPRFAPPTVLSGVPDEARVMREETFGPIAPITAYDDDEEVLARANDTEYGLAAYVYGEDARRLRLFTQRLQFGMVGVNTPKFTGPNIPFGGLKQSGLGREGGRSGIHEFTEPRYVCFGGLS
jgi:succinate-semialdehyde dehydrogenase/glutarate-semialdehyde dehydrogenase/aspartate-semialdehyde dehydrogenase